VVVTNPDEDCSPEAFRALIDELLAGPEPDLETIDAAAALHELRTDTSE
jgi:hypothetical protein